jgi:hypothetical protein
MLISQDSQLLKTTERGVDGLVTSDEEVRIKLIMQQRVWTRGYVGAQLKQP